MKDDQNKKSYPIHRSLYSQPQPHQSNPAQHTYAVVVLVRTKDRLICLPRALQSIMNQTFTDWQIVLINDGGNANELNNALAPFQAQLRDRLMVIHNPTSTGMSRALNIGIDASNSEFLVVHDDDDSWHPDFLSETVQFLRDPANADCKGVMTYTARVMEEIIDNQIIHRSTDDFYSNNHPDTRVNLFRLLMQNTITTISFLFYRDVINTIGYFNEDLPVLNDWDFNIRFEYYYEIGVIPKHLANYHFRPQSKNSEYGNSVLTDSNCCTQYETKIRNAWLRKLLNSDDQKDILGLFMALGGHLLNDMRITGTIHNNILQSPQLHTQVVTWMEQKLRAPLATDLLTFQKQLNQMQAKIDLLLQKQINPLGGIIPSVNT